MKTETPAEQVGNKPDRQRHAQALAHMVCGHLKWSALDYGEFQYEQGCAYLKSYLKAEPDAVAILERSRTFWAWWRNHWANRDLAFDEFAVNSTFDKETLREFYRDIHDGATLATCIYPNGVILRESYRKELTPVTV